MVCAPIMFLQYLDETMEQGVYCSSSDVTPGAVAPPVPCFQSIVKTLFAHLQDVPLSFRLHYLQLVSKV